MYTCTYYFITLSDMIYKMIQAEAVPYQDVLILQMHPKLNTKLDLEVTL